MRVGEIMRINPVVIIRKRIRKTNHLISVSGHCENGKKRKY
jgi:hypothetical protein